MTQKKLNKKLVVVSNQKGLSESEKIQDSKDKAAAQIEFPTIVPGIDPTALSVQSTISGIETNVNKRNLLLEEAMGLTAAINTDIEKLEDIFVDKWAKQIQSAPGIDAGKVKQLKFYVKGVYDGGAEPEATVLNSYPQLNTVIKGTHLVHYLNMVNSITHKVAKPLDVKDTEIYMFFGEQPPADYKDMKYLGLAKSGKYTVTFTEGDVGKTVWYFAVYLPRKRGTASLLAGKVKAMVI
jgi:hypothetical protein